MSAAYTKVDALVQKMGQQSLLRLGLRGKLFASSKSQTEYSRQELGLRLQKIRHQRKHTAFQRSHTASFRITTKWASCLMYHLVIGIRQDCDD